MNKKGSRVAGAGAQRRAPVALLVEDEWLIRDHLARALVQQGWRVLEASTGEGALILFEECPDIAILVTDIRLGGHLNGWDLAETIAERNPAVIVVYASGNIPAAHRRVPGSVFVSKPYVSNDIVRAYEKRLPQHPR